MTRIKKIITGKFADAGLTLRCSGVKAMLLAYVVCCAWTAVIARPVCIGGMCYPSEAAARADGISEAVIQRSLGDHEEESVSSQSKTRVAMGYMKPAELLSFLRNQSSADNELERHSLIVILLLVLSGGLLANLTPCVLPLVPVNLMLVGRGWKRGAAYGSGIAFAYGVLGIASAFGGMAFGTIQASPWFSAIVAAVFVTLGLAMSEIFFIDFSKYRAKIAGGTGKTRGLGGVFLLGTGAAVLAGACVEPILLATLLLTVKWFAAGKVWAAGLPFVLGIGMGLPWPFAAAGMSVLPRPGAWMRWVNRMFALIFFAMASWYGSLAWKGFTAQSTSSTTGHDSAFAYADATPATWEKVFAEARSKGRPVFVDIWATWCKNCLAMEKTALRDAAVVKELSRFTVVRLQAEDLASFVKMKDFENLGIKGIPAFVIFDERTGEKK